MIYEHENVKEVGKRVQLKLWSMVSGFCVYVPNVAWNLSGLETGGDPGIEM